ncbi:signal peptidase I [Pseudomonas sp. NA-150]|uniref:signal peptidase I n=1 Tax=Pseudomonas sp. NA-150 TaxID=3367525 RepID=UPI0037C71C80
MAVQLSNVLKSRALWFLVLVFTLRSSLGDWYIVPSGSMQPSIEEGEYIFVNKLAYTLKFPFTSHALAQLGNPQRGDVVVFNSKVENERLVKRIIGLPGDVIAMSGDHLTINGQPAKYLDLHQVGDAVQAREQLGQMEHMMQVLPRVNPPQQNMRAVTVPADQYLVLGDNRDNSKDSRFIGFVPRSEMLGHAIRVLASFDPDHYFMPRFQRFGTAL